MLIFWISTLFILLVAGYWLIRTLVGNDDWRVFGPMGTLMCCYLYYGAVGPWVLKLNSSMEFLGLSFYDNIGTSALLALVSFISVLCGHRVVVKKGGGEISTKAQSELKGPFALFCFFFGLHLLSVGGNLTQVYNFAGTANENDLDKSLGLFGFQQYFYLSLSCCVAPVVILWGASLNHFRAKLLAAFLTINLLLVFLATGFRLRIVFLGLAVASFMVLRFRSNPAWHRGRKWLTMQRVGIIVAASLAAIVAMSSARQYGRGVNLDSLKEAEVSDLVVNAFNDSAVYFCAGVVTDYVRDNGEYTWFETYKAAGLRMIPSAIIGEKPLPKTQEIISQAMGGGAAAYQAGFAVPFYAEHYISFGWPGLVVGSFALGAVSAWIGNRLIRRPSGLNGLTYALCAGFAFIFFHRGYFPQQLDYFMFMVAVPLAFFALVKRFGV